MTEHLLTPSKITAWLDCAHYLTLRHQVESGARDQPESTFGEFAKLLAAKGSEHEEQCLEEYRARGKSILKVEPPNGSTFESWVARVGNPLTGKHDVIYQMPFIHNGVRGIADFLERTDDGSYEPVDAKLARAAGKPGHVLQLCFYAEAIEELTGRRPKHMHLWLGSGKRETLRVAEFSPYWRRLRSQLAATLAAGPHVGTVPRPNPHCDFCEFRPVCDKQWHDEGALSLIAGIRRPETTVLEDAGVTTMAALAAQRTPVPGLRAVRQDRLAGQAALQIQAVGRPEGEPPPFTVIEPGADPTWGRGFDELPLPDDGDVFLDFEGHPFWRADAGLFFLFGLLERDDAGQWGYRKWWAHNTDEETAAVKALIGYLEQRRERFPDMHVYHYNHTERSSLVTLTEERGVAQNVLTELVETGLFVDLLLVARNSIQVGTESYGLKSLERLTDFERSHAIDRGAGAVLRYEDYIKDHDQADLDAIAAYNEDDVRATRALRDWLVAHRHPESTWRDAVFEPEPGRPEFDERITELQRFAPGTPQHLLGDLLGYWLREWRVYRERTKARLIDESAILFDDPDALDELRFVERIEKQGREKHPALRFGFSPQECGDFGQDDESVWFSGSDGKLLGPSVRDFDRRGHTIDLVWNATTQEADTLPSRVVRNDWAPTKWKAKALSAFADQVLAGADVNPAAMALLDRAKPQFTNGGGPTSGRFTDDLDDMMRWVLNLDHSYAAIQGPPGAGKTYSAAHLIHTLVLAGKRVGVTATTHHAIDNVVEGVLKVFAEKNCTAALRAVRKPRKGSTHRIPGIDYQDDNKPCAQGDYNLIGGTAWLFCSEAMRDAPVDVLLIDEAGQFSLADALAASGAAKSVVLLGDPLQLAQVTQASHPNNSGRSALEHILGEDDTMPADRGVFLSKTYRMHPDVCALISKEIYDGRLTSDERCEQQTTRLGTGVRWIKAGHAGNSTSSTEEADLIAAEISQLIGTLWTNGDGAENPLTADDFMVVAPYNDQVRTLRARLDADAATRGVPVGTVDKFQGREAAVVFFSMTTSTGEDMPRGVDFLFSRNRINVAISRARCLAYLVCTDALLDTRARDIDDMRLIATLNAVVEYALSQAAEPV
ncbi:TM0106 family RecB-like putative nuclease [Mycolicibacter acidiphilus]|uniref:TM0106 family RecB-like putative nuclease n=1 Tax=Mycolicibacter acidiphilus TaxID=2835306 RepID=UPI0027DB63FA|nr:TM0106 family RecB-like putative nuclease [Mycolicibacter acidiphilus]